MCDPFFVFFFVFFFFPLMFPHLHSPPPLLSPLSPIEFKGSIMLATFSDPQKADRCFEEMIKKGSTGKATTDITLSSPPSLTEFDRYMETPGPKSCHPSKLSEWYLKRKKSFFRDEGTLSSLLSSPCSFNQGRERLQ